MDGKAARVAETEAGAEGIKIASRAQLHRRQLKPFHQSHAIIVFSLENINKMIDMLSGGIFSLSSAVNRVATDRTSVFVNL